MRYEMMKMCTESVWDTMRRWQLVIDDTGSAEGINAFIYCTNGDLIWCYRCLTNWLTDNFERWSYSAPYKVEEWSSRNAICKKAAEEVHIQLGGEHRQERVPMPWLNDIMRHIMIVFMHVRTVLKIIPTKNEGSHLQFVRHLSPIMCGQSPD